MPSLLTPIKFLSSLPFTLRMKRNYKNILPILLWRTTLQKDKQFLQTPANRIPSLRACGLEHSYGNPFPTLHRYENRDSNKKQSVSNAFNLFGSLSRSQGNWRKINTLKERSCATCITSPRIADSIHLNAGWRGTAGTADSSASSGHTEQPQWTWVG